MSVLSPLLFVVVMDVVFSEAICGLPPELLYTDNVIMAPIMEQFGTRVAEWRGMGLKVIARKSKVMVDSSSGKMIVNVERGYMWCMWEGSAGKLHSVQSM